MRGITTSLTILAFLALSGAARAGDPPAEDDVPAAGARKSCRDYPLIPVCEKKLHVPAPPGDLAGETPLRQSIVDAAISKLGAVNDIPAGDCRKHGWKDLLEIYTAAYGRDLTAPERATLKRPKWSKTTETKLNDWCGIFALWAVKKGSSAALKGKACGPPPTPLEGAANDFRGVYLGFARWKTGKEAGGGIDGLPFVNGTKGLRAGDIVAVESDNSHFALVERVVGDTIYTIDGNMDCQMIIRKKRTLTQILGYYPVE